MINYRYMPARRAPVIHLAADHAAVRLKDELRRYLVKAGHKVVDMGSFGGDPADDYPDLIIPAAEAVAASRGRAVAIVMGGSGIGECIAANKVPGVRAALVHDAYTARVTREHNDSNVLCLGSRTAAGDPKTAKRLARIWLTTPFSGESRHKRRIRKILDYERRTGARRPDDAGRHPSPEGGCVHDGN